MIDDEGPDGREATRDAEEADAAGRDQLDLARFVAPHPSREEFRALLDSLPYPQAWYDEDSKPW